MESTQVAIIGAGPTGLALAVLLQRRGVAVTVLEARATLHLQPQAHILNARTMEILREIGVDRAATKAATPYYLLRSLLWCHSLAGAEYGRASIRMSPAAAANSPGMIWVNLAQNKLEPILLDRLRELGGDVRFGVEAYVAFQDETGVVLTLQGSGGDKALRADYVVACDGASSPTRATVGVDMVGAASTQKYLAIYFEANLDRFIAGRMGSLQYIVTPEIRGNFIAFGVSRSWAFVIPYAESNIAADFTSAACEGLVRKAIGDPDVPFKITSVGDWVTSAQVAARFRVGRVFLAGDAAHRMPPEGGLGLNTCVGDAHNLGWKLAAVLRRDAEPALLDTYEIERMPVARVNNDYITRNEEKLRDFEALLGRSMAGSVAPEAGLAAAQPAPDLGLEGDGPEAVNRRTKIAEALDGFINFDVLLQSALGLVYEQGAVINTGSRPPPALDQGYAPITRPGALVPHVWLTRLGRRISTVDLPAGGYFFLAGRAAGALRDAVLRAARDAGVPLRSAQIGVEGVEDPSGGWEGVLGLRPDQGVLIRPDNYVAWRSGGDARETEATLLDIFATLAGRSPATPLAHEAA